MPWTSFCMGLISRKLCRFLLMFFSVLLLFPLSITLFIFMHSCWFCFIQQRWGSLNHPSANVFVFGDFNVHHKTWLTYSGILVELIDLVNSFSNQLTQIVNFPTRIPDCNSHTSTRLDLFLLKVVFALQWLSLHWEISIMLLSQSPLTFIKFTTECPVLSHSLWLFSCWLGWSSRPFQRCSMGGYL